MLLETAQLLLIEDQCDLKKRLVVLQCVGEAVELVLGCSSCAWGEPGREAAPWALPCLALPASNHAPRRPGSHRGGQ